MFCPYCKHEETKVIETRIAEGSVRRRRECGKCEKRFTTYERVEDLELFVIKRDGRREKFDRNKLKSGIMKACEKRPIAHDKIEEAVGEIEAALRTLGAEEVKSKQIGELVMERLKNLDEVAYIRFASVYRKFSSIESFEKEIEKLKTEGAGE